MKSARPGLNLGLVPLLLLGLLILPLALYWGDLPNPMATHWDLGGRPNGRMPPLVFLLVLAGLYLAIYWAVNRAVARVPSEGPSFISGLFALGGLLAAISWLAVLANRNQPTWEAADGIGVWQILLAIAPALVLGTIGWFLAGGAGAQRTPPIGAVPALEMDRPREALWSSRGNGPILQAVGAILVLIALISWGWSTLVLVLLGVLVLVFAEVRTTVSRHGVVVSMGWLGIPSWTVSLRDLSRAEVETVDPMAYGGWGYRLRPGVRAIVTRSGEALRLVRPDKADLVLTVDDAATGAGLINSMLEVAEK
jgi:hypothetical protein